MDFGMHQKGSKVRIYTYEFLTLQESGFTYCTCTKSRVVLLHLELCGALLLSELANTSWTFSRIMFVRNLLD